METPKEFLIEWLKSYTGLNTQSIYDLAKEIDYRYAKALQLQQTGVVGRSEQLVCSCGSRLVKTTGDYYCGNAKCSV